MRIMNDSLLFACLATVLTGGFITRATAIADTDEKEPASSQQVQTSQPTAIDQAVDPPTRQSAEALCRGIIQDARELDALIKQLEGPIRDESDESTVRWVAKAMCENHANPEACEVCMREVIEFAAGRRIRFRPPPADEELRNLFRDRRDVFLKLRDMILSEENLSGIGADFLSYNQRRFWLHGTRYEGEEESISAEELLSKAGITQDRHGEYLSLLTEIGANRLTRPSATLSDRHPVSIMIYRYGNVASGYNKDIEHFAQERFPEGIGRYHNVVECTDEMPDESEWYAPLGDGWFIHFSRS